MHARWKLYRGPRGLAQARLAGALAACGLWAACASGARAQPALAAPSAATGAALPPASAISDAPGDPIAAAARAQLDAAGAAASSAEAERPARPRNNPFTAGVAAPAPAALPRPAAAPAPAGGAAVSGLVIPATPIDPAKVVVDDHDGLISLLVREGSLRQVIAMIADTQKLNIVFAGATDTMVTAAFERQPWQTVLDSLLSASGHVWAVRDNVIFVSSIESADFLPPGAEGRRVAVFELDFASATDIHQTVEGLLSPAGESWLVEASKTDNRRTREAVAVVDYPAYLARVSDYICQADQPPRQVYIEANILQVELKDDCKSGVNFENIISLHSADVTLKSVGMANPTATTAFFVEPDGVGLNGLIELLKTTTDAKTLASPKIHAVSGQESHIQIGGQLGYRVTTTTQTSTMESVQFLDVGVVLKVTPRITRDGRVLMRIFPKVSTGQVDPETGLPSEETTEVDTDVLLSSGQGVVIGGLIQESDSLISSKVPYLGEIPYLGILFQRRQETKSRQEIIVTLQPHVLPYSPIVAERLNAEYMRTVTPLTQGAIVSYPRPFEPKMYDAWKPEEHKLPAVTPTQWLEEGDAPIELLELPPIESTFELQQPLSLQEAYAPQHAAPEPLPAAEEILSPALEAR
jgi:type II secretory pathway component GspD/PulD (secretin)